MRNYLYIFGTIMFTVYGQLVTKWQVTKAGSLPTESKGQAWFLLRLIFNPWVLSCLMAAFLAFLCWVAAMTKFELSYAYPGSGLYSCYVECSFCGVLECGSVDCVGASVPLEVGGVFVAAKNVSVSFECEAEPFTVAV